MAIGPATPGLAVKIIKRYTNGDFNNMLVAYNDEYNKLHLFTDNETVPFLVRCQRDTHEQSHMILLVYHKDYSFIES